MKHLKVGALAAAVILTLTAAAALAFPPPPPPQYVVELGNLISRPADAGTVAHLATYIADDGREYENGRLIADGKAAWLAKNAKSKLAMGRLLGISEGRAEHAASLMVVDQFDTVDRSNLPKTELVDPRFATRATVYRFGEDGKVHLIQILTSPGFWTTRGH